MKLVLLINYSWTTKQANLKFLTELDRYSNPNDHFEHMQIELIGK